MAAAMIPIVLAIVTLILALVAGWQPFTGFVGIVVLGMFALVVGGLVGLVAKLEAPDSPTNRH